MIDPAASDWDIKLPYANTSYNARLQQSLGTTPFFIQRGYHYVYPEQAEHINTQFSSLMEIQTNLQKSREQARLNLMKALESSTYYGNAKRQIERGYFPGDLVAIEFPPYNVQAKTGVSAKLIGHWYFPYFVRQRLSRLNYELQ